MESEELVLSFTSGPAFVWTLVYNYVYLSRRQTFCLFGKVTFFPTTVDKKEGQKKNIQIYLLEKPLCKTVIRKIKILIVNNEKFILFFLYFTYIMHCTKCALFRQRFIN